MKSLEPDENIDRDAYLALRLPPHEVRLDKTIAGGRVTSEAEAKGALTQADAMQVEIVFDGAVQGLRTTGRAIISADVELGLIVFYEAESADSTKLKANNGKALRFARIGKVEIRRKA
jgi:hypothetical protein